jgi:asparagine synthase (glutamine-hydrolysing)
MLTYGYMLDDSTYVQEIHRLMPGCFCVIGKDSIQMTQYYKIGVPERQMSKEEAIEILDKAFRRAIAREFDKDREYGYRHLVDLSAGLDSRMVSFVADDMGYTDQLNITYSKLGYQDDTIPAKMARHMGHEYLFKSLDDIKWMYDIDEMTLKNNGAAACLGMTGGNRLLQSLNLEHYGIEHTGISVEIPISGYYHDKETACGKPQFGLNGYSTRLHYDFDEKILDQYETQDIFSMYTRCILGMQTSYMTRQHYLEATSIFADVDMLDEVLAIPIEYRLNYKLYLDWAKARYPDATKFGWEYWGGVKPKNSHIFFRKVKTTQRLLHDGLCRLFRVPNTQSMNPMDYWYNNDEKLRAYLQEMYEARIGNAVLPRELAEDMKMLYRTGNFTDKSLVLTVLSAVNNYFN